MKLAKRTERSLYWQCEWVARRWLELVSLDWELRLIEFPELRKMELFPDERPCLHVAIGD